MPTTLTRSVPVTADPDVQAIVEERGLAPALEQMAAKAPEIFSRLKSIHLSLAWDVTGECGWDEPLVCYDFRCAGGVPEDLSEHQAWSDWYLSTFPPKITSLFVEDYSFEPEDEG